MLAEQPIQLPDVWVHEAWHSGACGSDLGRGYGRRWQQVGAGEGGGGGVIVDKCIRRRRRQEELGEVCQ